MQFFLIVIEIKISLLTKSGPQDTQITIMIDTQQQYIKLNIRGEISIIVVQAHSGRKRDTKNICMQFFLIKTTTIFL
jgi:hypothetical protein